MHKAHVALHKHLGYAGSTAEVAVYLEWGMRVPQVVQGSVLQKVAV